MLWRCEGAAFAVDQREERREEAHASMTSWGEQRVTGWKEFDTRHTCAADTTLLDRRPISSIAARRRTPQRLRGKELPMRAMQLDRAGAPLVLRDLPVPRPAPGELLIRVRACAVCRTDLHVIDGELPNPKLPLVPGHEIVGEVVGAGKDIDPARVGQRVGVPWLGRTCGACWYCRHDQENLCDNPRFTGYTRDGGYAEFVAADARFCFPLAAGPSDAEAAPLLCAGLIGYRSLRMAGDGERLGLYGFGAAAHIVAQVAVHQGRRVYAFTRAGDAAGQQFARTMGAVWAGGSEDAPPEKLDAAILFAPVGALVPAALKAVRKGGIVVCGGIHMSDIPSFPYSLLWEERVVRSVANLTRRDGEEFLALAPQVPVRTTVTPFPLEQANEALRRLRHGELEGAAVLLP
jgi:alcohol dehydrogenase, propanol-preferring